MQKRTAIGLAYTLFSACVIIGGTVLAVRWANGDFRRDKQSGEISSETGLLNAVSVPTSAQVYIDGNLTSATDNVLYLQPGTYDVVFAKDGYSTWQKTLQIERGLVTNTEAKLFPSSPNLTSLSFTGAENLSPSPDGQKLVFYTASTSATIKNGLYLLDISLVNTWSPKTAKQIARGSLDHDLGNADFLWSSDSSELLVKTALGTYSLPLTTITNLDTAPDITNQVPTLLATYEEDMYLRERDFLSKFPQQIVQIATNSAKNVYLSPDKKKLVYTATESVKLADKLLPQPLPAASTQPQTRQLEPGTTYVYDMYEDRNFSLGAEVLATASSTISKPFMLADDLALKTPKTLVATPSAFTRLQTPDDFTTTAMEFNAYYSPLFTHTWQWLSDSRHLVNIVGNKIIIVEYDATNATTVYSGPFLGNFVYPWADGSRLLILTTFSPDYPPNIYSIELVK